MRPVPTSPTPAALGFRMPAEFEPQAAVWLAWPGARTREWTDAAGITAAISTIAAAIGRFEQVRVVADPAFRAEAAQMLGPRVELVTMPVDDIWARDSGPTFLVRHDGAMAATSWSFNAWGDKFDGHEADATLAARVAEFRGVPSFTAGIITEGGGLHVDGEGTVVVTESALLNANRNPGLSRADVEAGLKAGLGADKVIWIPGERNDSITDGHVDGLMTFTRPGAVLFEVSADPAHPRYHLLNEQRRALELATDARGRQLDVGVLVHPRTVPSDSPYFCGLYVNCLIVNGAVLIPAFGDGISDAVAQDTFRRAFPGREVVPLRIDAICAGGGGIHCVSQQEPLPRT
jgi:agmatine deiminase